MFADGYFSSGPGPFVALMERCAGLQDRANAVWNAKPAPSF